MDNRFTIKHMTEPQLQTTIDWAQQEGWNPGLYDCQCFYQADPNGFFVGLLDGKPIATGSAVAYDDQYAFCGLYIVKPEFRGCGYGMELTKARLNYLGGRCTGIDGVINNVSKYQNIGYVPVHKNITYQYTAPDNLSYSSSVIDLKTIPFTEVERFDRCYFPAARPAFLRRWIHQPESFAQGYLKDDKLIGYGVIRKCFEGYKIGPLFAESPDVASEVFKSLCSKVQGQNVAMMVPEPNKYAIELIGQYHMQPKFEVMRMYRNGFPDIDLEGIYGFASYELG